jgi:hypothetical protein
MGVSVTVTIGTEGLFGTAKLYQNKYILGYANNGIFSYKQGDYTLYFSGAWQFNDI